MAHQGTASLVSLLSEGPPPDSADEGDQEFLGDLRLDQVIEAVAGQRDERDLIAGLLRRRVRDAGTLEYWHEVFADLEDPRLFEVAVAFCGQMQRVRSHLRQLAELRSSHHRGGWFLDSAAIYCDAVRSLADGLPAVASRALRSFSDYLAGYLGSPEFAELARDTADRRNELAKVVYLVRIKGPRVEVSKYDGEPDYSAEIEETFERFRQGAVKDYRVSYRIWPGMNHVGERILDLVARLFSDEFGALAGFCERHAEFGDPAIARFDREIQFYLAYLDYVGPMRSAGLSFCLPDVSARSKEVFASDTFDLALAAKLVAAGGTVVTNDFELRDPERVIYHRIGGWLGERDAQDESHHAEPTPPPD